MLKLLLPGWRLLAPVAGLAALGCVEVCPRLEPTLWADGGAVGCASASECPRSATTLVCADSQDRLATCVDCVDGRCVTFSAAPCP